MVERTIYKSVYKHLAAKQFSIVIGARQVGKTTLLRQLYRDLNKAEEVYLINIEEPEITAQLNEHPNNIFRFTKSVPPPVLDKSLTKPVILLLDEVQYLDDPSHFLKYLFDTYAPNIKIIATGSSAFYIDKKFTDSLAGRKRLFYLYPFSFPEYLIAQNQEGLLDEINFMRQREDYQSLKKTAIVREFLEFLKYGGYPDVVLAKTREDKIEILNELKTAYIKRDILESGLGKTDKFFALFSILAGQIGNLVNKNELSGTLQLDIRTVENYLYLMQKSFHIRLLKPFYQNRRKELTKMPKVYFNDLGLRNAFLNRFSDIYSRQDKGELLENYVFKHFNENNPYAQIRFWRTIAKQEVDFIVTEEFQNAWEVKWSGNLYKPNKYKIFNATYPNIPLQCISFDGGNGTKWVFRL